MLSYYKEVSPEAIVMHLHDRAEFGPRYADVDPTNRISLDEVCEAFRKATENIIYGRDEFVVSIMRPPQMDIAFGPGFCFDEAWYDAEYGVGAAIKAVRAATEDQIAVNIGNLRIRRFNDV